MQNEEIKLALMSDIIDLEKESDSNDMDKMIEVLK